jgi:hypothetical protein
MLPRIGIMRALHRNVVWEFKTDRKDMHGAPQIGARSAIKSPPGVNRRPHLLIVRMHQTAKRPSSR